MCSILTADIYISKGFAEVMSRKIPDLMSFLIWCSLRARKAEISNLLHDIHYLGNLVNAKLRFLWELLGVAIIITVPLASWLCVTLSMKENMCKHLVLYFSFLIAYVPEGWNCRMWFIITFLHQIAAFALRTAATVLYVIVCCYFRNLLNKYSEKGIKKVTDFNSRLDSNYFRRYLEFYENIMRTTTSFENSMSSTALLITISDCMGMLYGLERIQHFKQMSFSLWLKWYSFSIVFFFLRGLFSFLCVSLAASSVHEASKRAKTVQEEMLKKFLISNRKDNNKESFLLFVALNRPPFVFSAWGFFYFTKSLVFSAFGTVLTYALLITQILR
ncbi:uncharacterized protein TNIN_368801 [Trichonephila inaurata madagascariensis]|uniref:Gustatory receptor n=1 Tax=Trichonephila inaurata madagascariensis TaxID=2747483 RepID=A0A8X6XV63_9ARAC|nr:uncharacterized protein TNIN_368801 [Trichonephila inaurata madagascariensis]